MTEITTDSAGRSRLRVILAAALGPALEWYDSSVRHRRSAGVWRNYSFQRADPVVGTLLAFLTFGVGMWCGRSAHPVRHHGRKVRPQARTGGDAAA